MAADAGLSVAIRVHSRSLSRLTLTQNLSPVRNSVRGTDQGIRVYTIIHWSVPRTRGIPFL